MSANSLKLGVLFGLFLSVAIVSTNVIWPSFAGHQTPDTEWSVSFGWVIVAALVCGVGYSRMRRTAKFRDAAIAGATVTFIAFGIAMVTFVVIDKLFFDIICE